MSSRNAGVLCDDTKKGFVEDYGIRGVARNFPEVRGSFPNHLYTKIRQNWVELIRHDFSFKVANVKCKNTNLSFF